jgi:magnesium-transporting ATPase (P-type)
VVTKGVVDAQTPLAGRSNSLFMGTHVVSGAGEAVVAATGRATQFGAVSARLAAPRLRTGFERGLTAFGVLLVQVMLVLVTAIFVINLVLRRPIVESLLFSLALAVGLTPQLLPAIVSISLATGAKRMAAEQVIVKRLDAIEDFSAMTVLCTDKTGTITAGAVRLDEIPYDFQRKRLSVLVDDHGTPLLVSKAPSTTRRWPTKLPTSASRWTPRSTSLGRPLPSCCWTRAMAWWPTGCAWAGRPSPTPSSTSGSPPAPTSATCSAWRSRPASCRSCRCCPARSCC